MAISTLAELKTVLRQRLARGDLDARMDEFIALGESVLNARLRLLAMQKRQSITLSAREIPLPDDFAEAELLEIIDSNWRSAIEPSTLSGMFVRSIPGLPAFYAITAGQIELDVTPDIGYTGSLVYYQRLALGTSGSATNWLLQHFPDCYLYAAMVSAGDAIKDSQAMGRWISMLEQAIAAAENDDRRRRNADSVRLACDAGLVRSRGNFFRG